jgi:hypothetical protein
VGLFSNTKRIEAAYGKPMLPTASPLSISSPWAPQDSLVTWALDDALGALLGRGDLTLTRETAMRVPGIARAHAIICTQLASIPFFQMDHEERTKEQPRWLTTSDSSMSPYHRLYGAASDWFFYGWACFGFTEDMSDCFHIPYGLWSITDDGEVVCDSDDVPAKYKSLMVPVPLGFGENGVLVNGADTIRQARNIEAAYVNRLDNPVPLSILTVDGEMYDRWSDSEIDEFLERWVSQRQKSATAVTPSYVSVTMPGQVEVDLYETGRNGSRIDIANHTSLPASILDGLRQGGGGGGSEIKYSGASKQGAARSELWDYGMARRMMLAFEARMSLDDVCEPGLSIRGDISHLLEIPTPNTNPTSED